MAARPPFALDSYYNAPSTLSIRKQTIALDMMKRRTAAMAAAVRNLTMLDTKLQRLVDSRAISSATTSYSAPMYPPAGAGVAPMPGTAWIVGPTGQLQPLPYAMPPQGWQGWPPPYSAPDAAAVPSQPSRPTHNSLPATDRHRHHQDDKRSVQQKPSTATSKSVENRGRSASVGAEREKAAGDGTPIHRHSTPQPQPIHERVVEEPDAAAPVTEEPTDAVELSPHTHKLHKLEAMLNHDMDVDDLLRELDLSDDEDGPGNVNGSVVEENPLGKEELDALKDERAAVAKRTKGLRLTELQRPRWRWEVDTIPRHGGIDDDDIDEDDDPVVQTAKLALKDPDMWLKGAALFRATVHTMCFVVRAVVKSNAKKIATRDTEKKDLQQMLQAFVEVTRGWLGKSINVPLQSIVVRSKADNVDLRFHGITRGPLQSKAALQKQKAQRALQLRVRSRATLDALIKCTLQPDSIPYPLMSFLKKLCTDGAYFPEGYLFQVEQQTYDFGVLGNTRWMRPFILHHGIAQSAFTDIDPVGIMTIINQLKAGIISKSGVNPNQLVTTKIVPVVPVDRRKSSAITMSATGDVDHQKFVRRGSVAGEVLFKHHAHRGSVHVDPVIQIYTGFQGDLGRCELMLTLFVFGRILLPQVVLRPWEYGFCSEKQLPKNGKDNCRILSSFLWFLLRQLYPQLPQGSKADQSIASTVKDLEVLYEEMKPTGMLKAFQGIFSKKKDKQIAPAPSSPDKPADSPSEAGGPSDDAAAKDDPSDADPGLDDAMPPLDDFGIMSDVEISKLFYPDAMFQLEEYSEWIAEQQAQLKLWITLLTRKVLLYEDVGGRKSASPIPGQLFTPSPTQDVEFEGEDESGADRAVAAVKRVKNVTLAVNSRRAKA